MYSHVAKAIQFFKDNTPLTLELTKAATSSYHYGSKLPFCDDRLDLTIIYGDNQQLLCQVIFNSSDYSFPPDIVVNDDRFDHSPAWLPNQWDITDPSCLLSWLSDLQTKLDKAVRAEQTPPVTHATLCVLDSPELVPSPGRTSQEYHATKHESKYSEPVDLMSDVESADENDQDSQSFVCRRDFVQQWISDLPNHIMQYDIDSFLSVTLYLSVDIPTSLWDEMEKYRQLAIETKQYGKLSKARQLAPVIVRMVLDKRFPHSLVDISLISTINSVENSVYEPDSLKLQYTPHPKSDVKTMINDIR
ncbi:hypothetical protein DFQ28_005293 [Apophysomyces sp. BC1034]|nr:hypothetical protein DFQ28_005293 [Apophysomyces sp. BC1034]